MVAESSVGAETKAYLANWLTEKMPERLMLHLVEAFSSEHMELDVFDCNQSKDHKLVYMIWRSKDRSNDCLDLILPNANLNPRRALPARKGRKKKSKGKVNCENESGFSSASSTAGIPIPLDSVKPKTGDLVGVVSKTKAQLVPNASKFEKKVAVRSGEISHVERWLENSTVDRGNSEDISAIASDDKHEEDVYCSATEDNVIQDEGSDFSRAQPKFPIFLDRFWKDRKPEVVCADFVTIFYEIHKKNGEIFAHSRIQDIVKKGHRSCFARNPNKRAEVYNFMWEHGNSKFWKYNGFGVALLKDYESFINKKTEENLNLKRQ